MQEEFSKRSEIEFKAMMGARDFGINSILFRNALAKKQGLNLTESFCLTILGIKGVSTPTELARYTGLTTGSTTTMLDRLEKKKCIRRKRNSEDRRGVIIEINDQYAKKAQNLVAGIQKAHKEVIESYSDKELEIIADFLTKFAKNMIDAAEEVNKK